MSIQKTFLMAMVFFVFLFGCAAIQAAAEVSKSLVTGDQVKLDFDYYPAQQPNSPTVILLPDTRCDRKTFGTFPSKLNKAGFNVMAMDLRYKDLIAKARHMPQQIQTIQQQNFDVLVDQDLKSVLDFLSKQDGVDPNRICILGTSLGSRVALASGVKYKLKALVLVSLSSEELFTTRKTPIKEPQQNVYELGQGKMRAKNLAGIRTRRRLHQYQRGRAICSIMAETKPLSCHLIQAFQATEQ
jgi:predicted esterase